MKLLITLLFLSGCVFAQDTMKKEETFTIVEIMPEPPGGIAAFYKYIANNLQVPVRFREMQGSGKTYLNFIVETDGSIAGVRVIKKLAGCPECDAEAVRVVESYKEKWKPGSQNGTPARVYYNLPISFKSVRVN